MNRLSRIDRERVVACLCEGNSIRATVRITGVSKKTVARLGGKTAPHPNWSVENSPDSDTHGR